MFFFADEENLKKRFAEELCYSLANPMAAASRVFGDFPQNYTVNAWIAHNWPNDPIVAAEVRRRYAEDPDAYATPRELVAARLLDWADSPTLTPDEKIKALKLYADMRGYIAKPGLVANIVNDNRRVLVVPSHGSEDDWEKRAIAQQAKLIAAG